MHNVVQRFLQHLIKWEKIDHQLCEQDKNSDESKTFMRKIVTKYDLGRERKKGGNPMHQDQLY